MAESLLMQNVQRKIVNLISKCEDKAIREELDGRKIWAAEKDRKIVRNCPNMDKPHTNRS